MQLEQWADAVRIFNKALEIDPAHKPSRDKRTEARRKLGEGEE